MLSPSTLPLRLHLEQLTQLRQQVGIPIAMQTRICTVEGSPIDSPGVLIICKMLRLAPQVLSKDRQTPDAL